MVPYTFAVGENYTYFISTHYKFIENDKIQESSLLNSTNDSLYPYDYHVNKNGLDCSKESLERNRIHCSSVNRAEIDEDESEDEDEDEDDINLPEIEYTNGSIEPKKISIKNVFFALSGIVIINLNCVYISVFVRNVIKIKVKLIY